MTQNRSSAVMQQRSEPHDSLDDFPTPPSSFRGCGVSEIVIKASKIWPSLVNFQHFQIDDGIARFAWDLALEALELDASGHSALAAEEVRTPTSARSPAPFCTLTVPTTAGPMLFVIREDHQAVFISRLDCQKGEELRLGRYIPGQNVIVHTQQDSALITAHGTEAECLAWILALINEPRIVTKSPALSRQVRRAAHRGFGFAVDAWTRVSWDLSKETVAKVSSDPTFHRMPLHWCRGHYRRAEPHFAGAHQRPDALRPEDRALWWQWIDGVWRGHPAFGVKRSVHAPKLSGTIKGRRAA